MRILLLLLAAIAAPAPAAEGKRPDEFNMLFATTCMQYFHDQGTLRAKLQADGLEALPPDQAGFFLGGAEGTVWMLVTPATRYVVSLRKDKVCSVFAQRGDREAIQPGFLDLVGTAPSPLVAEAPDTATLGPNDEHARTVARSWARPRDTQELLFVLTTSTLTTATAQVMASMALVDKEKPPQSQ